jgi:hypothetical protein
MRTYILYNWDNGTYRTGFEMTRGAIGMNRLTGKVSSIQEMIDMIKQTPELMSQVTYWHTIPPRPASFAEFPDTIDAGLRAALADKGIDRRPLRERRCVTICRC